METLAELADGIHAGIPFDEYRALPGINISTLTWADVSAAHLKAALDGKLQHDSADMAFGRAMHSRLLEPEEYRRRFIVAGPCEATLSSGARKGMPCGNPGRSLSFGQWLCGQHAKGSNGAGDVEVLTPDQGERLDLLEEFVRQSPVLRLLRQRGGCEVTVLFTVEGQQAKARLDKYIPRQAELPPIVLDLKKVQVGSLHKRAIEGKVLDYAYDAQAAWYVDAVKAVTGDQPQFIWVFLEDDYPFSIKPIMCDTKTLEVGRLRYRKYLGAYIRGMETGEWPGVQDGTRIEEGGLPAWFITEWIGK